MGNLNVLYACDDNYAPYATVSICSLLENNKNFESVNIYVVLDKVSSDNVARMAEQIDLYHADFIPVDAAPIVEEIMELGLPQYRNSYGTNFRLFFDRFIKADVKKLLYLDCDTIVCGELVSLLEYTGGGSCAYVVQDSLTDRYKFMIGISDQECYFNAGVMLIDVEKWKENRCTQQLIEHIKEERANYCNPDQDLLNIVLKNRISYIGPEYNFQPIHRMLNSDEYKKIYHISTYYEEQAIEAAKKNPVILHTYRFLGEFPWHIDNLHPDTEIFDYYLKKSTQREYVKKKADTGFIMKIEKTLFRILPGKLFFRIFKMAQEWSFERQNKKIAG